MAELERRRLGKTEMRPRALGMGWAHIGRADRSDENAIESVRRAIELGVDYVDTSPAYGDSERKLGLALADGWRDRVLVQTKTGTHPERRGDYSAAATRWSVENSLRLLKTDYLDAVLIHDPHDIEAPLAPGACLDELLRMKEKGLVRHVGLGCRQHSFHKRAIETGQIEIVLSFMDYHLLSQSVASTTLPLARQHDVGIQLATVLAGRKLSGEEPHNDARAHAMWQWCRDRGVSLRHLAVQFALAAPIEGMVIVGPGTPQHVEEVVADATTPVPPDVWTAFREAFGVGP